MAAGAANVTVNTQTNVTSTTAQFSSDGTPSGVLQPFPVLSDANRTPFFTGTNPGSVSITGGNVTASLAANQTLGTLTAITNTVNVAVTSSVPAGTNTIGSVNLAPNVSLAYLGQINGALPAGTNALGSVTVSSGNVSLTGSLPAGSNALGSVTLSSGNVTVSLATGQTLAYVGQINGALPAGSNALGSVSVSSGNVTASLAANQTLAAVTAITNTVNAAVTSALPAGSNTIGAVNLAANQTLATLTNVTNPVTVLGLLTNPTSTLTRPANTTAYTQGNLVASNTTAVSVVVPSVSVARVSAGSLLVRRLRLTTNKTSGMGSATFQINLWSAAPTYTNGDGGAYAVATGAAGFLGSFTVSTFTQFGDGAAGVATPAAGSEAGIALASGQLIYWDLQVTNSGGFTPASGQTFTLTPEVYQN